MEKILREERGLADIVALIIIIAIVAMAYSVFWLEQTPQDQKEEEYKTAQAMKESFLDLRTKIQKLGSGDATSTNIRTSIPLPHPKPLGPTNSTIHVEQARSNYYLTSAEYVDPYFGDSRAYDHYIDNENPNQDYTSSNYDNDHLYISTTEGKQKWTYLKFDFKDVSPLYDSYDDEFEAGVEIKEAKLLLYIVDLDTESEPDKPLEIQPPIFVEAWWLDNDSWDESMTWNSRVEPTKRVDNTDITDERAWVSLDVTKIVKDEWEELIENELKDFPKEDNQISFTLRYSEDSGLSSLHNGIKVPSEDNTGASLDDLTPQLRLTYTEMGRIPDPSYSTDILAGELDVQSTKLDLGYVKYTPKFLEYPEANYYYEGGLVFETQEEYEGYEVLIEEPKNLVQVTEEEGTNNIYLTVTRYQIEPASIQGSTTSGAGSTPIFAMVSGINYLASQPSSPNRTEVRIGIVSEHQGVWRDYLRKRLAPQINAKLGGDYDPYGDYVHFDYDTSTLTIYGKDLGGDGDPETTKELDIYYTEKVVWLDVDVGYSMGGRT